MINWKELSGDKNWAGLLSPLSQKLGDYIIFYGDRVQELYDSIDSDSNSPTYELPIYDEKGFFPGVRDDFYTMECYLNASAEAMKKVDSNARDRPAPIGFVAVATDKGKKELGRRDILVCFRGTLTLNDFIKDLWCTLTSAAVIFGPHHENVIVHSGFLSIYQSVMDQARKAVKKLVNKYQHEEISITVAGHSLGAALGTLAASDIVANGLNKPTGSTKDCMVSLFSLASPRVGNSGFTNVFNKLTNLHLLHTKHIYDIVPHLPFYVPLVFPYSDLPGVVLNIHTAVSESLNNFPIVLSGFDLFKYHYLKNLLKAVKEQEGKRSLSLPLNLAVEQLKNGDWKIFVPASQAQVQA